MGSMEDKRLFSSVTLGEGDTVWFASLVPSSVNSAVRFLPSTFSNVLLTAAKTTGDGVLS